MLVLVQLDHPLAQQCPGELELPLASQMTSLIRAHIKRQNSFLLASPVQDLAAAKPAPVEASVALPAPRASYNLRKGQRIQLQGA